MDHTYADMLRARGLDPDAYDIEPVSAASGGPLASLWRELQDLIEGPPPDLTGASWTTLVSPGWNPGAEYHGFWGSFRLHLELEG